MATLQHDYSGGRMRPPPRELIGFEAAGFPDYVLYLGQVMMLLRRGEGDCGIEAGDADDGAVEVVEGFFVDDGGDFSGEASGAGMLVEDDDFVGLLHRLRDGFAVDGNERTQVEDFDFNSLFAQDVRCF